MSSPFKNSNNEYLFERYYKVIGKFEMLKVEKEEFLEFFEEKIEFLKTQKKLNFELFSLETIQKVKKNTILKFFRRQQKMILASFRRI